MTNVGTIINNSATVVAQAGADIANGPFTAVAYKDGAFVGADGTLIPFGIAIAETDDTVAKGEDVTVQVKDISKWKAGGDFAAGDFLTADANGAAVKATAGKFILAVALENGATGQVVNVQIVKAGFAA